MPSLFRKSIQPSTLQRITAPILLGLLCLLVYNANFRQIGAGDTLPARYLPLILWSKGTLKLDGNAPLVAHGHSMFAPRNRPAGTENKITYFEPWAYWIVRTRQNQLASLYPVVTPLLVAPLYLPAVFWLDANGWDQPHIGRAAEMMEKISASFLASVACILMYLVLRRECGSWSLPLALVFAFGTNTWMTSSQALWQHGTAQFLIALALLLTVPTASRLRTVLLGTVCVLIAANRPPDALLAGAFVLFTLWSQRRDALWLLAGAAVPLAALLYYNLHFVGHYAGSYALGRPPDNFFQPGLSGLAGLLISPSRGLLVFSPFLVFVPLGLIHRLRSPDSRGLAVALSFAVLAQMIVYSQIDWRAGESWGPRWLTDMLPILMWMLAPAPMLLQPFARGVLVLTMVLSVGVQSIGAFWYTKTSDELIFAGDPASMKGAWKLSNLPFLTELSHSPAKPELLYDAKGSLDRVGSTRLNSLTEIPHLESGSVLEGWALTGGHTPAQLLVLIDGIVVASTTEFLPREDVNEAMNTLSLSGWRVFANTDNIIPGERVLQLAVRIEPRSHIRIIRNQKVFVIAKPHVEIATAPLNPATGPELKAMAKHAASMLRERQSEQGFWLTAYTEGLRYESPQPEMNTYLTALLVDMLTPIKHQHGFEEAISRSRRHLAAQIESNGLVRYHGLPDGATIGTKGHIITPDSDDTALAWRIAGLGAEDPRSERMLKELSRYRDSRGLYRTWLAPQKDYRGLDPGRDPNPTDMTIQMHIYLMLRELDPPAAKKLGEAMQRSFHNEDVWVYYAKTPLIPYLRSVELRQLGCPLPVPTERLVLPVEGQEVWCEAGRRVVEMATGPRDEIKRQAVRHLLGRIGHNNFAQIRVTPALLYHNDLSATVKRFYWSEDFSYALWLRLYEAAGLGSELDQDPSQ
ncbi:hypothetical protein FEM03_11945 [Phragmitibacter flavus]|uniref:Glycosyltransferase RgtA/B/C/D-like domain-containing protein n=1 Tax=Phragmitibacter flavus TaxID=2576071 RepID=A0A5R8KDQ6_9BACT|nr:hypothetical protein [Phragmitibacter flavus]TLD70434.1 hypothetical protein FEM03_11945 [Phragmitibacter flavus]